MPEDLLANRHVFMVSNRKQAKHPDVRIHVRSLKEGESSIYSGLPATGPSRIASDLLAEREDPEAVVIVDAIRRQVGQPSTFVDALASRTRTHGLRRGNGHGLLG